MSVNDWAQWAAIVFVGLITFGVLKLVIDMWARMPPDTGPLIPNSGLEIGTLAPDFTSADKRSGQPVRLSDYAGQRLVLAFLSPVCGPCRQLVPHLNQLAREERGTPVMVVAMPGEGMDYTKELSSRIIVVGDPDLAIEEAFKARGKPLVYVLDEERKVLNRTISNKLVHLEDTLAGLGTPQGNRPWMPVEAESGAVPPDGVGQAQDE